MIQVKSGANYLLHDTKAAATTAAGTTLWGFIVTFISSIPEDIGKLGALIGIVLSVVLIVSHWRKMRRDDRLAEAQLKESKLKQERLELELEKARLVSEREAPATKGKGQP